MITDGSARRIWLLGILFFICCSDNNFDLIKEKDGRIIKLNKKTGEMFVLQGDTLKRVIEDIAIDSTAKKNDQLAQQQNQPQEAAQPKTAAQAKYEAVFAHEPVVTEWSKVRFAKDGKNLRATAALKTKWEEEDIKYVFLIKIVSPVCYNNPPNDFSLNFYDKDGFMPCAFIIHVNADEMTKYKDNKTIEMCVSRAEPCSRENYKKIVRWAIAWGWQEKE